MKNVSKRKVTTMQLEELTPQLVHANEAEVLESLRDVYWESFPSLNRVLELSSLEDGQFVTYRGMVQDMLGIEFYVSSYRSRNPMTNELETKSGKYMEYLTLADNEVIQDTEHKDLQRYVVVPTPAENQWVKDIRSSIEIENQESNQSGSSSDSTNPPTKKQRTEESIENRESVLNMVNEVIRREGCVVKVYDNYDNITLNQVIEFVGFIRIQPQSIPICCIHCVSFRKLKHENPIVGLVDINRENFMKMRNELMIVLTQLLLGDSMAAEFLLCHLISSVFVRKDLLTPVGKFSLNISNVPIIEGVDYVKELYEFIQLILPKSLYLPFTVQNLNESVFIPKRDLETDKLNRGILQLSPNTNIVIDETKMQPGVLNKSGLDVFQTLSNIIRTQSIPYDFVYCKIDYECDLPILIMSEGKSMLPSDFHIALKHNPVYLNTFKEIVDAAKQFLNPELLNGIREYLTLARFYVNYVLEDNMVQSIQEKFIEMRRDRSITGEDLHNLLVLSRSICISYGRTTLDDVMFSMACQLDQMRKRSV